jgi:hypothetical protein
MNQRWWTMGDGAVWRGRDDALRRISLLLRRLVAGTLVFRRANKRDLLAPFFDDSHVIKT